LPLLPNPRHEQFSRFVAAGMTATDAYAAAGFSGKGAAQSASRLAKRPDIAARIAELTERTTTAITVRAQIDRDMVLAGLRRIAENGQTDSVKVRALELLGKTLGLFRDEPAVPWSGDLSELSDEQLERMANSFERLAAGQGTGATSELIATAGRPTAASTT
jgi:hypothetical protein